MTVPRIAITPGEPAGIGPDLVAGLCLQAHEAELVVVGDAQMLMRRARMLGIDLQLEPYSPDGAPEPQTAGRLKSLQVDLRAPEHPGRLDTANAAYVLDTLATATRGCLDGHFDALVTGPVHKGVINDAGIPFSGHTEFLAEQTGGAHPVMLLVADKLRVALATTHLPLNRVSEAITPEILGTVLRILDRDLRERFDIARPQILVCGLNPHAGESGHLGREEIEIIAPTLERLREEGLELIGPLPADTLFTPRHLAHADAVLAMYHDQGLPVLKYAGFGQAVNVTLGLPIIRTSVDHGTALDLAGTGQAESGSLEAALSLACSLANRQHGERG